MNRRTSFFLVILLAIAVAGCQPAEAESVELPVTDEEAGAMEAPAEPVVFPSLQTDVLTYSSEVNGREYVVYVTLPLSYEMTDKNYPVIYVTDGDFYTLPVAMTAAQLAYGREMPETIIVGIGYGGSANNSLQRREEDLNPSGSESFLQFLQEELIPDIESSYRADPAVRTLMGHSSGGTFALYALFNAADTFSQFVASSPCSPGLVCSAIEEAYAGAHDELTGRLYASLAGLDEESKPGMTLFTEALVAGDYEALAVELPILDGETHLSARPRALTSGMKWVFAGES